MLPQSHRNCYECLLAALEQLQAEVESSESSAAPSELIRQWQQVQQEFQLAASPAAIASAQPPELDGELQARWQALHTEIHRDLRLLQADILYLQASRQAATAAERRHTVRDRLERLLALVRALLQSD
ncbi:hypothetical protein KR51_00023970 [Rubidibacter lacunae KORDI 51-2]|uniref:Heterocyst frequency control protein PatD n=1 Tax=Rubidibacter lacunae KORDI 51-2 TaxID=582515 RepID=U5D980_9CHRO|nr:heterocyst frequency control protein PatD [Rubidibacter lacunae]ERN41133.1 hypothetical protein KR51_00023970 [Rubidibacter lacunae KORDI 51-2]